jgi:DNA polymerase I-like protein with 3'-5' exonuclease and polymerase domains
MDTSLQSIPHGVQLTSCTCASTQMHDELLFEVPEGEVNAFTDRIRHLMESVQDLKVPLLVNIQVGKRWGSMARKPLPKSGS